MRRGSVKFLFFFGIVGGSALGLFALFAVTLGSRFDRADEFRTALVRLAGRITEQMGDPARRDSLEWMTTPRGTSEVVPSEAWLLDGAGHVVASATPSPFPFAWSAVPRLVPGEVAPLASPGKLQRLRHLLGYDSSSLFQASVIRLNRPEERYLVLVARSASAMATYVRRLFIASVTWTTLICALVATVLFFSYFRRKAREAMTVLARLAEGDLDARFALSPVDEVGQLMLAFNQMADRIGALVRRVQSTERARRDMLEEISHDLRTPLTASVTAVETLARHYEALDDASRKSCIAIADKELHYLKGLVEDVFFLAEAEEPRHEPTMEPVDLAAIVTDAVDRRRESSGPRLAWDVSLPPGEAWARGNAGQLARLVGNALDNAVKFARGRVAVSLASTADGKHRLRVRDDGEGVSDAQLATFGKRRDRASEAGALSSGKSLGLGSVIMTVVAKLHDAELALANWRRDDGSVGGAEVTIVFPALDASS